MLRILRILTMTGLSGRSRRLDPVTWTYLGSEGLFERDFEISKKNLHPWDAPYGGMFLEVKNPKNPNPKVVFHPNRIFKNHHFVEMFHLPRLLEPDTLALQNVLFEFLDDFWKKFLSVKPVSGLDFWNFSLPKTCPQHGEMAGEKISKFQNGSKVLFHYSMLMYSSNSLLWTL